VYSIDTVPTDDAGSTSQYARIDHVHNLAYGGPAEFGIGMSNSSGSGNSGVALANHKHKGVHSVEVSNLQYFGDIIFTGIGGIDISAASGVSGGTVIFSGSFNVQAGGSTSGGHVEEEFTGTGNYTFTHNLGNHPQITVLNSDLEEVEVSVTHTTVNEVYLEFSDELSGSVYADLGGSSGGSSGTITGASGYSGINTEVVGSDIIVYPTYGLTVSSIDSDNDGGSNEDFARSDHTHKGVYSLVPQPNGTQLFGTVDISGFSGTYIDTGNNSIIINADVDFFRKEEIFSATGSYSFSHNLGMYPHITVLSSTYTEINVVVTHSGVNNTNITFGGALSGAIVIGSI